jgi:hypothetical protein
MGWRWCPLPRLQGGLLWCYPVDLKPGRGAKRNHLLSAVPRDRLLGHGRQWLGVATTVALNSYGGLAQRQIGMGKVLYTAQGVHGIGSQDSNFSFLQFEAWFAVWLGWKLLVYPLQSRSVQHASKSLGRWWLTHVAIVAGGYRRRGDGGRQPMGIYGDDRTRAAGLRT